MEQKMPLTGMVWMLNSLMNSFPKVVLKSEQKIMLPSMTQILLALNDKFQTFPSSQWEAILIQSPNRVVHDCSLLLLFIFFI